jgi:enoyl-CoA hydratase/carnithine racemase
MDVKEAERSGLVNKVVTSEKLEKEALAFAK